MFEDIFFALWFFLPAGIANVVPIFAAKIPLLRPYDAPIDGGRSFRGKRIFGSHKTWRGMVTGIIFGTLTLWLQQYLVGNVDAIRALTDQVDYAQLPTLLMGPLFAIGALGGDAIESFFKRQRGIAPGKGWFPFDQTDYIIGGAIATMPFVSLGLWQYAWLLGLWLLVHVISTVIGYFAGLKESPL
ncbi:MAG TPA: CDP-archaeol synthase [Candidatus Saccharimonadales bacterium]|nr:CDP-archaeol synthase [Candidatus Saccharimonadales bacterium]